MIENNIKQRLEVWKREKVKIRQSQYKNHLISLDGDILICTVVIHELEEILQELSQTSEKQKEVKIK